MTFLIPQNYPFSLNMRALLPGQLTSHLRELWVVLQTPAAVCIETKVRYLEPFLVMVNSKNEKRLSRYRSSPSKALMERMEVAMTYVVQFIRVP